MDQPNDASLYQRMNNPANQSLTNTDDYWPPPPGFPPNYTGWGVVAGPATVQEPKNPITWPLVIAIGCLVFAVLGFFITSSSHDKGRQPLDLDAAAKPLIETGSGSISSSGDGVDDFDMTVNGKTLKLTQIIYEGVQGDIDASLASSPYYILAAYLPNTKQVVESQIYDKQGGKLLANFTNFPDSAGSYKASLKERYEDVANSYNLTLVGLAILVLVAGWCGWLVYKRLRA